MTSKKKKIGKILLVVLLILIAIPLFGNFVVKQKIESAIDNLPESVMLKYEDLNVSILSGDLELKSPTISVIGQTSDKTILDAELKSVKILDLSYWEYITDGNINLKKVELDSVVLKYLHNPKVEGESYNSKLTDKIKRSISVVNIDILNSDILITEFETDSTILSVPQLNFKMNDFSITSKSSKAKIPFEYGSFNLNGKNLKWDMGEFENLNVKNFDISKTEVSLQGFTLKTKYSRQKLSSIIKKERDHFEVEIQNLKLNEIDYGFTDSNQFYFNASNTIVSDPKAKIYRDKLVTDDTTEKPLYGKMLRELNFNLGLKTVEIKNGIITYAEKVKADKQAGTLDFKDFNATISNLGNTFGNNDTAIDVKAKFMENAPLNVGWNFKVSDTTDQFTFKADLGLLNATQMDQFTEPNLNVDLDGEVEQTYFTINGGPNTSNIDFKMKYEEFKVSVLDDNGKGKKGLLSGLVNLFVSKDSDDEENNFRYGYANNVERDKTKSIFNYIWLNIKEGLLSAMTGDGEKKEN